MIIFLYRTDIIKLVTPCVESRHTRELRRAMNLMDPSNPFWCIQFSLRGVFIVPLLVIKDTRLDDGLLGERLTSSVYYCAAFRTKVVRDLLA